ncbi:MAG: glycosyl transferase [Collinsella tanakaei]|nr:MAG: glycosyl transferase [Collinsella tanakaei]
MGDIKFSVLMSVYYKESAEYFNLALSSNLLNQTLIPSEMILVCDGKLTDELEKVINVYQNKCPNILKVYRLEENVGLGKALNFGLDKCTYEIVARSDSDDVCVENRFEKQLLYISTHDVDIVSSAIDEFACDYSKPFRCKKMPVSHKDIVKMAKFRNPINHMAVMFKKSVIINAGSYMHLPYVEDYYLWVRAINNGAKLANINDVLVHARVGNGMENRRGNKAYISSWKILSQFMLKNKLINRMEYLRNMIFVRLFVYMPIGLKKFVYRHILRKEST